MMDKQKNKYYYLKGIKNGMPICLGYLAVSFTLGITARNAGMTAWQAMLTSLACNASAGQYAGFTVIAAGGTYFEMILMELVANARYLLMSCSLSQKFSSETGLLHRLLVGYDVTDEIFGVAVSEPGKLNPFYNYGMMTVAIPGWSLGTFLVVIPTSCFLDDLPAIFDQLDLASCFSFNGMCNSLKGVNVLHLCSSAEFRCSHFTDG